MTLERLIWQATTLDKRVSVVDGRILVTIGVVSGLIVGLVLGYAIHG